MKKIFAILISLMFSVGAFAEIKALPPEDFKELQATFSEGVEVQVAYFADSWDDVYKKTNTRKYHWEEGQSGYVPGRTQHYFLLIKVRIKSTDSWGWLCFEYPGDETYTLYGSQMHY